MTENNIHKLDFNFVIQSKKGFTTFLNDVIQNIPDAFILGLYTYLSSLPPSWNVNRVQLMKHFSVGKDKLHRALKWLNEHNLISYHVDRLADGTVDKWFIVVHEGLEFIEKFVNKQQTSSTLLKTSIVESSTLLKIQTLDKPDTGKTATINTIRNKKEKKKERESALSASLSDFVPNEENEILARDLGVDLAQELESFRNRHKGEKTQYEFGRWLKSANAYAVKRQPAPRNEGRSQISSSVPAYGPGHPTWEANREWEQKHGSEISRNNTRRNGVHKATGYIL